MQEKTEPNSRQREIIRSAAERFYADGYGGTTVRDIAAAVGVRSGSIFYHFGSKEEILRAVMEWGMRVASERAERALDGVEGARERLLALSRAHLQTLLGEANEALAVTLYEWDGLSPGSRDEIVRQRDLYEGVWQRVLEEAAAEGLMPVGDLSLRRRFILGALNWTVQWYSPAEKLDAEALARRFVAFVLNEEPYPRPGTELRDTGGITVETTEE